MSRLRIAVNGRYHAAPVTGVQRFAHEVVRRIARHADVTLLLPRGVEAPCDVECDVVNGTLRGHAWERLELPRAAARLGGVVLHPANTAAPTTGPYVLVLHDVLPLSDPAWFAAPFALWGRMTTPRAARGAARIVTVSEWSRRAICAATGVAGSRVLVAPQGLEPFTAPAGADEVAQVRARYDLPARFVLAVGDDARKNVQFLVQVLEQWRDADADAPALVIAGSSQRHVHGSPRAARADADANVRVLGRVTDGELRALYTAALALCSASHAEGFGRPPLEAIGCGTPVVAAPYGAAAETLAGAASARVVPLSGAAWVAALREVRSIPASVRAEDAAALHARWTWDGAAAVVLRACQESVGRAAVREVRPGPEHGRRGAAPPPVDRLRVALVHDWLTGTRGGERVLEALAGLLPHADLFTLFHVTGTAPAAVEALHIRTSFLDALPAIRHWYRYGLPLFPAAVERLDLRGYDLIVSSSHCVAKAVRPHGARHLCYCHTPMRYAWDQRDAYLGTGPTAAVKRALVAPALDRLRRWDADTVPRVHAFVANSEHVRGRIARFYGRDARVVHPPVAVERFAPAREREDVHVCAGALVPYKRIDLAVAAFNRSGRRLLVVGDGPEYRALRRNARTSIEFTGRVSDAELAGILGRARALVMPMVEDFGIIAVEAQAAGAPVIALGAGGALETVIDGETGVHFGAQTAEALADAVVRADRIDFDTALLRRSAQRFSSEVFAERMRFELDRVTGSGERDVATMAASCT